MAEYTTDAVKAHRCNAPSSMHTVNQGHARMNYIYSHFNKDVYCNFTSAKFRPLLYVLSAYTACFCIHFTYVHIVFFFFFIRLGRVRVKIKNIHNKVATWLTPIFFFFFVSS